MGLPQPFSGDRLRMPTKPGFLCSPAIVGQSRNIYLAVLLVSVE